MTYQCYIDYYYETNSFGSEIKAIFDATSYYPVSYYNKTDTLSEHLCIS